jgi:hypothetical protein
VLDFLHSGTYGSFIHVDESRSSCLLVVSHTVPSLVANQRNPTTGQVILAAAGSVPSPKKRLQVVKSIELSTPVAIKALVIACSLAARKGLSCSMRPIGHMIRQILISARLATKAVAVCVCMAWAHGSLRRWLGLLLAALTVRRRVLEVLA